MNVEVDGKTVRISNPDKVFFPTRGWTKWELVHYYLKVAPAVRRSVVGRPTVLRRMPDGVGGRVFYQKRPPRGAPPWLKTVAATFPSGRRAQMFCCADLAHLLWAVNAGCVDLHAWASRCSHPDTPDELRLDLDPAPGIGFEEVKKVAVVCREVLGEAGVASMPKTSGSRGIHVLARIAPRWSHHQVRRAGIAAAREVQRRLPSLVTLSWWKEERGRRIFIDYNQNGPDRALAAAWSVRPNEEGTVSFPFRWEEIQGIHPGDVTLRTAPALLQLHGDPMSELDEVHSDISPLLEWAERDAAAGLGDLPWPPNFPKMPGEPPRVQPSRARHPQGPS